VSLANSIMARMEIGFEKRKDLDVMAEPAAEFLKLTRQALDAVIDEVRRLLSETASSPRL
jgi:hypothetical protein